MINEQKIQAQLVEHGNILFHAPRETIRFTGDAEADELLNDITDHPHAYMLACLMDRQIKAERAWLIPYRIKEKLGGFSIDLLRGQSQGDIYNLMTKPEPLHRFVDIMSGLFYNAIARIYNNYSGNASKIWSDSPSSSTVIYRFLEFEGIGPKIASMATNILARGFKVIFSDYYSIDISADVHVRRVFTRLGLISQKTSIEQLIFRARGLHPEFPGLMDFPTWEIGRKWCKSRHPNCMDCYMTDLCGKVF